MSVNAFNPSQPTFSGLKQFGRPVQSPVVKFVQDPLARMMALPIIRYTSVKPWQVTLLSLISALGAAAAFFTNRPVSGALLFEFSQILDGVDGYVARAKRNGSVFGIVLDGYADVLRVLLSALAMVLSGVYDSTTQILLFVFVILHFAESFMDFEFIQVEKFLKHKQTLRLNPFETRLVTLKTYLESKGFKSVLFHYQERLFTVLVLGPAFHAMTLCTILALALMVFFFHFKLFFDITLIKLKLIQNSTEYLRGSGLPNE